MVEATIHKIRRLKTKYQQFVLNFPKAYGEDLVGSKDSIKVDVSQYGDAYLIKVIK